MGQIDVSLKHAIAEFPQDWAEFLRVPSGVPVQVVDADVSAVANVADKALLVRGDPEYIVHVEPHGWYDENLDVRMLGYNALMSRRYGVFVHSVVLLLDRRAWGPANKGCVVAESPLGDCRIDFRYQVIKAWELPVQQVLAAGVGVLPLAPIAIVSKDDLPQVVEQMEKRFNAELPRTEAAEMWTATFVLVGLKYDRAFARVLLQKVRDTMRESTTYQEILDEGKADGKQDDLIKLGTKRFGQPDAETVARINSIEDLGRLDALLLRLLDVNGWDELLAEHPSD
jgi:predicted transposase YdaD